MGLLATLTAAGWPLVTLQIEPYLGRGGTGDTWGPPVAVPAHVEYTRRLVRDATGSEVVSESRAFVDEGTVAPPRSRVTVPGAAAPTRVLAVSAYPSGAPAEAAHVELALA